MKPWWPRIIVKPQLRLARPRFGMPSRPPEMLVFAVIFVAILFILGGNIYTLVKSPPAIAGGSQGQPILIAPGIDVQLGMEGIVASVVILMGTIGFGLLYFSSKYVFQPSYATRLMFLGILLAGLAFMIFSYLFAYKVGAI